MDLLKERHPSGMESNGLKHKISAIRNEGLEALARLSNDLELIVLLRYN